MDSGAMPDLTTYMVYRDENGHSGGATPERGSRARLLARIAGGAKKSITFPAEQTLTSA
jgi:hypothetical protein